MGIIIFTQPMDSKWVGSGVMSGSEEMSTGAASGWGWV